MVGWTKEAILVHNTLLIHGLETPLLNKKVDNLLCKRYIKNYMLKIITLLNLDIEAESLSKTPERIANMYVEEIFSGLDYTNFPRITVIKNNMKFHEMITIRNIVLTSTCEHHFVIFSGEASVSYIPNDHFIGLSKISRIVHFFSQRPQLQERLTQQIFFALKVLLNTDNVAIFINAVHFCVKARGIRDVTSSTTTFALGGLFKSSQNVRQEFIHSVS